MQADDVAGLKKRLQGHFLYICHSQLVSRKKGIESHYISNKRLDRPGKAAPDSPQSNNTNTKRA